MDNTKDNRKLATVPTEEPGHQVNRETQTDISEQQGSQPTEIPPLSLTQEQEWAVSLWETKDKGEIATAVGVSPEVLTEWENQKLFTVELTARTIGGEATTEEKQAAVLVWNNFSYAQAEATIGLEEGTIIEWARDSDSEFNWLLKEAKNPRLFTMEADSDIKGLNEEKLLAIPLIIEGKTDAQVGEAIGKSRETINRWRNHDRDFIEKLNAAREAHIDSRMTAVTETAKKAITVLNELLNSDDEKIRLQAATLLVKTTSSLKGKK